MKSERSKTEADNQKKREYVGKRAGNDRGERKIKRKGITGATWNTCRRSYVYSSLLNLKKPNKNDDKGKQRQCGATMPSVFRRFSNTRLYLERDVCSEQAPVLMASFPRRDQIRDIKASEGKNWIRRESTIPRESC